ncbi:hypothetical protein HD553DRAFT_309282 [Filobasidium floriforme]|nr:uncharacterized protein HD553DRAFT_309282 [Filobasidium floriforme]KAH8086286.1 hypothetical protein HD553DRAFT_309282 [Filobasidium floriforme]
MSANSEDVASFMAITGTSDGDARKYLSRYPDVQGAVSMFFAEQAGEAPEEMDTEQDEREPPVNTAATGTSTPSQAAGAYTLSGQPVGALPSGWGAGGSSGGPSIGRVGQSSSGPATKSKSSSKFATLGSLGNSAANSDDEDEVKKQAELYAGGQGGSGMAIQGPDGPGGRVVPGQGVVQDILKRARDGGAAALGGLKGSDGKTSGFFGGGGMTLGSDEAPSVAVPDPSSRPSGSRSPPANRPRGLMASLGFGGPSEEEDEEEEEFDDDDVQIRNLTFWREGFSIEDGPLMTYDDPHNKEILEAIKSGRAPLSLLNVKNGQAVEVRVAERMTENYRPAPPKPMQAFDGSGQRLGAPAPQVIQGSTTAAINNLPSSFAAAASGASARNIVPTFEVDQSKPVTSVQIRLADGSKQTVKLNLTHTVGDLRGLVSAAQTDRRQFVLQTTFPTKVLEDDSQTVEAAGLKNAVVVQRWA